MLELIAIIICAGLFYRIGLQDYGSGWGPCILSILSSLFVGSLFPLPLVSVLVSQGLLYIALLIYNMRRKLPPGSHRGL